MKEQAQPANDSGKVNPDDISKVAKKALKKIEKDDVENRGGTQEACCNEGVSLVFEDLTGSQELRGMRANDMVEHWSSFPNTWKEIKMSEAQDLANQGYIVVAGAKAGPNETSGHVVVIVPGEEKEGGWGWVPVAMDTGENKRWTSEKISKSWKEDRKQNVRFFLYKGPVNK